MSVATTGTATAVPAVPVPTGPVPTGPVPTVVPAPAPPPADLGRTVLRLLPAPESEPPYDDELPARRPLRAVHGLAGAFAPTAPPALLRLVPQRPDHELPFEPDFEPDDGPDFDEEARARTPLAQLPAAHPFAQALVQRLLEVQAGLRPLSQLQPDTSFELFTELEQTLPACPPHNGRRPSRRDVRSVHVQTSEHGVAEVCATVRRSGRTAALALRLEGLDGAWRCTALLGV